MRIHFRTGSQSGFTLLELMIVVVILGILAAIVAPQFMDEPHKARVVKAQMQMQNISTALQKYYIDNGFYPSTEQGLKALVTKPNFGRIPKQYPAKGYLPKVPLDPWESPYVYISPGKHGSFDLISYGADGLENGEDNDADIRSWELE